MFWHLNPKGGVKIRWNKSTQNDSILFLPNSYPYMLPLSLSRSFTLRGMWERLYYAIDIKMIQSLGKTNKIIKNKDILFKKNKK